MDLEEAARLAKEYLYRKLAHGHFVQRMGLPNPPDDLVDLPVPPFIYGRA